MWSPTYPPINTPKDEHKSMTLEMHPAVRSETPLYCRNIVPKAMADQGMHPKEPWRTITVNDHTFTGGTASNFYRLL